MFEPIPKVLTCSNEARIILSLQAFDFVALRTLRQACHVNQVGATKPLNLVQQSCDHSHSSWPADLAPEVFTSIKRIEPPTQTRVEAMQGVGCLA